MTHRSDSEAIKNDSKFERLISEYVMEVLKLKARMVEKYGKRIEKYFTVW